jgi:hypothetical protein
MNLARSRTVNSRMAALVSSRHSPSRSDRYSVALRDTYQILSICAIEVQRPLCKDAVVACLVWTRAENGPKFFGPARSGPSFLRPGPVRAGIFPELSLKCLCIVFYLFIIYRNICFSGYFYCITYVFIVLSMFRETFRKFS